MTTYIYNAASDSTIRIDSQDFRYFVFGVGMERSGMESLSKLIDFTCIRPHWVRHEAPPYLAQEAKLRYDGKEWQTENFKSHLRFMFSPANKDKLICECNHRLAFFIDYLYDKCKGRAKFIWFVRNPYDYIASKIENFRYWPSQLHRYDKKYQKAIIENNLNLESIGPLNKREFDLFRIEPNNINAMSLVELHLWEWVETFKITKKYLDTIPEKNYFICRTELFSSKCKEVLKFIEESFYTDMFNLYESNKILLSSMKPKKRDFSFMEDMKKKINEETSKLLAGLKC